ncbi:hypothetical protein M8J77_004276 [Diaphorina citri]|nr:hypothetical protein M8J77_004276 [Diaphorina citri]
MEGLAPTLFGKRLSFANEVKYLGVNLDPKLTWNKHLESIKLKCTRSLMMARRTFGKSWGLKPRVMSYLYREVIRPTVTYCAVVWWPKTHQRQAKELLDKIQRLGCPCITSAMSSTPTLAMETLLGLTPLDIHVKGTARTVAHRLKLNNTWIPQHHGHSIITTAISDPLFEMRSDMMAVEENFDNPVNVVIETAGNWGVKETQLLKKGAVVWYTDGSKTEAGSGAGIHCVKPRVPGHKGIVGNEQADHLARMGSSRPFIGPEPVIGLSNSETRTFIKSWAQKAHQDRWDKVSGLRHSKLMMLGANKDLTMNILSLNRKNTRLVTSLITGHCGLRKHLQTMGLYQGQVVCSLCGECKETATHVIFECNSLTIWRLTVGLANPQQDIHRHNLTKKLLKIARIFELS